MKKKKTINNRKNILVDSTRLLTASGDQSTRLWDVSTGEQLKSWDLPTPGKAVSWATGDKLFLTATASVMGKKSYIYILNSESDPSGKTSFYSS